MLDIRLIREKTDEVRQALLKKNEDVDFTEILALDKSRREMVQEVNKLREVQNKTSSQIPVMIKEKKDISTVKAQMKEVSDSIKKLELKLSEIECSIQSFLEVLPNIPMPDVVAGGKENNTVVRSWGQKPDFGFKVKDHVELVTSLGLVDYERGVKLGGSGFWIYKGFGAALEWGLLNYFIEQHRRDGYEFILVPHILTRECGYTAGQFPKFRDDVFVIEEEGRSLDAAVHFLLPTAETALVNYHRGEIIGEEQLPLRYFSYSPCYRKEAGSYRTSERGMIRGHQFNKVELFQYTKPEDSEAALEQMLQKAERLVQGLGLHYQVSKLAAADCSHSMAKTFDIEVWIPSMQEYKEVSSASNASDYQARRGNLRFRRKNGNQIEFLHTLNASGLATSRLIPAIVEQFQQPDGSVIVPKVLHQWVGKDILHP
ncbi:MAG: serine--tRNA ligase [Chitinivibrionales bacterium]|nr:serine--tRNA ligase [Chitinivibrionales bacterium]